MSAWRREALERFPERRAEIQTAFSIYDLLGRLEQDLRATYRGEREEPDLADRVFKYAEWCFDGSQNWELQNAVAVGFYEHLPNVPDGRRDIVKRLSFGDLTELQGLFHQMLRPEDYEALQEEVERVHGKRLPALAAPAT